MGTHPIFESDFDCLTDFRMASSRIIWGGLGALSLGALGVNSMYTVEGGHRAVIFSRFGGVGGEIKTEGLNFRIPWLEWPLIYDIRARPFKITSPTGTSDLQMVDIGLRVLYRPDPGAIQSIAKNIGEDFAEKILPSITHETLKSVIANFNASALLTRRNEVSNQIRQDLEMRAKDFSIILDDVAITDTQFSPLFTQSIEAKQIAQQEAFQARYVVMQAKEEKKQKIVSAEGEAASARLVGEALKENPAYLKLQRIEYGKKISKNIANGGNKVMLPADNLLLDIQAGTEQYNQK